MSCRLPAALVGLLAVSSCAAALVPRPPIVTADGVEFVVSYPDARSVAVAGSFNGWSASAHVLTRNLAGSWRLVVPLPAGEHAFMYVVDGAEWRSPPAAEDYVDDGFGSKNGVVIVRPVEP